MYDKQSTTRVQAKEKNMQQIKVTKDELFSYSSGIDMIIELNEKAKEQGFSLENRINMFTGLNDYLSDKGRVFIEIRDMLEIV